MVRMRDNTDIKLDFLRRLGKLKAAPKSPKQMKLIKANFFKAVQKKKVMDPAVVRSIHTFFRVNVMGKKVPRFAGSSANAWKLYYKAVTVMDKPQGKRKDPSKVKAACSFHCNAEKIKKVQEKKLKKAREDLEINGEHLKAYKKKAEEQINRMAKQMTAIQATADGLEYQVKLGTFDREQIVRLRELLNEEKSKNRRLQQNYRRLQHDRQRRLDSVLDTVTKTAALQLNASRIAEDSALRKRAKAMVIFREACDEYEHAMGVSDILEEAQINLSHQVKANFPGFHRQRAVRLRAQRRA